MHWLVLLALWQTVDPAFPGGEWRHADIRGIESVQNGACLRMWIEERTYILAPQQEGRTMGVYGNVVRTTPIGAASFAKACTFPPPATKPLTMQSRAWNVVATFRDTAWGLRAAPGLSSSSDLQLQSEDFATRLSRQGVDMLDGLQSADDEDRTLVFRRAGTPPKEAWQALEDLITKMTAGGCLQALNALVHPPRSPAEVCAARAALTLALGHLTSLRVQQTTSFDRVPLTFPSGPSARWRRQQGLLFEFTGDFENGRSIGHALVYEDGKQWHVAMLWF